MAMKHHCYHVIIITLLLDIQIAHIVVMLQSLAPQVGVIRTSMHYKLLCIWGHEMLQIILMLLAYHMNRCTKLDNFDYVKGPRMQ